jgi:predicted TIM-barrel fold metal-dependent hydrolase
MTIVDEAPASIDVTYGIYDADQHYYEAEDAITRHLEREHQRIFRWIDMNGRRTLLIHGSLLTVVPNPTYDPVGAPGSLESYFRSRNPEGREARDLVKMQPIQPEYRNRDARVAKLDEQGVDFAWLLPSLGLGLEETLCQDPISAHAVFRAYNKWLEEDWGYDRDGRIQTGPLITLLDPVEAEREVATVIAKGARFVTFRPAPVREPGRHRSLADPAHDRVWAQLAEAGVVAAFHAADSGYLYGLRDWGESDRYMGIKSSALSEVLAISTERPIYDTMAALVCHGLFDRHPTLKVATVELGSAWVPELHRKFAAAYGKTPQAFKRDPCDSFREHVSVAPFYEDDIRTLVAVHGEDRVLLGSDWPHPEGLETPRKAIADFRVLTEDQRRRALRDNLKALSRR